LIFIVNILRYGLQDNYSQRKSICDGRVFIARHARTKADLFSIAEVNYKCSIALRRDDS